MKTTTAIVVTSMLAVGCLAQRGSYSGLSPIGFPVVETQQAATNDGLADRLGEGITTTTMRLPIEARGDANLYNRLRKLPVDQQPFWVLNWEALEVLRKNPKSYPRKDSDFAEINDIVN